LDEKMRKKKMKKKRRRRKRRRRRRGRGGDGNRFYTMVLLIDEDGEGGVEGSMTRPRSSCVPRAEFML